MQWSDYWPANTVASPVVADVWDEYETIFEVQSASCAAGDVGAMADFVAGTPNATVGSTCYLDSSTATSGKTFNILGLVKRPNNDYGAYAKVSVLFIEHVYRGVISGAGGV